MSPAARTRPVRQLIALTMAALVLAWLLPGRPVPIYDGVGAPDEPYRYVSVPAGIAIRTKPPTAAKVSVPVDNGVASVIELATSEQGPQAEADIVDQSLTVPPAAASTGPTTLTAILTPLAPGPSTSGALGHQRMRRVVPSNPSGNRARASPRPASSSISMSW